MVIAMAATRKLQGEIDRCLKKVSEGVETFEDIWQKVHNATNTNQKEKYETDLKKEIKKLQRLRDQIKSWIASGEIKDKSTLVDTRKLIETQMERFKVVERETKTKAYSKEGLGATQKLDPTAREREELNNWLVASIDQMQIQMDQFESEIESIMAAKKKRLDKEKQDRLDELKIFMERHKFHMSKLETLMRMLDNLSAEPAVGLREFLSQVKKIKDDIEYYLESSQEAEFEENEFLYDDIEGLEEQQALGNLALTVGGETELAGSPESLSGNNSPVSPIHSSDSSSEQADKRRKSSDDSSSVLRPVPLKGPLQSSPSPKALPPVETLNNSSPSSGLSNHVSSLSSLNSSPVHNNYGALNKSLSQLDDRPPLQQQQPQQPSTPPSPPPPIYNGLSSHPSGSSREEESPHFNGVEEDFGMGGATLGDLKKRVQESPPELIETNHVNGGGSGAGGEGDEVEVEETLLSTPPGADLPPPPSQQQSMMEFMQGRASASSTTAVTTTPVTTTTTTEEMLHRYLNESGDTTMTLKSMAQDAIDRAGLCVPDSGLTERRTMEAHIPPLLGVAPLGPVPLQKEHHYQLQMLEAAHSHLPVSADSERMRQFLPRNPFPAPPYYPQHPLTNSDSLEFFQRLSIETLFFIFYYLEGTKAQYLAAKVLKKQSWRFHTKYMMWFQRHEEPKVINEDYEQGTYIYFDIEKWGQRKKDGFVFEYRYLEDRELS